MWWKIVVLSFTFISQVFAAEGAAPIIESYLCQTQLEHPDSPTPLQVVELRRDADGSYQVLFSENTHTAPEKKIASGLKCRFSQIQTCDLTQKLPFFCLGSAPEKGALTPDRLLVDCENADKSILLKNVILPEVSIVPAASVRRGREMVWQKRRLRFEGSGFDGFELGIFMPVFDDHFCKLQFSPR